jgi:hypothetical protein
VCFVVWKFYFEKLPCGRAGVVNNRKERSRNKQETKTIAAIEKKKQLGGFPVVQQLRHGTSASSSRYAVSVAERVAEQLLTERTLAVCRRRREGREELLRRRASPPFLLRRLGTVVGERERRAWQIIYAEMLSIPMSSFLVTHPIYMHIKSPPIFVVVVQLYSFFLEGIDHFSLVYFRIGPLGTHTLSYRLTTGNER